MDAGVVLGASIVLVDVIVVPGGVKGANPDLVDLTNGLDAACIFMDPRGILGTSMVLVDVLVDPGCVTGATPGLVDLTNGLLDAAGVFIDPGGLSGTTQKEGQNFSC